MTEKRFTRDEVSIYDNGEFLFDLTILMYHNADEVVGWLNALHEENQELKQFKEQVKKELQESYELYVEATIVAPAVINNLAKRVGVELDDRK